MNNIGEYNPVNFDEVENVNIVDDSDKDYQQWRNYIYNIKRKTKSQLRREEERKLYPEEWRELKNIYLSRKCSDCKRLYEYPNHKYYYRYTCWGEGIPTKIYNPNNSAINCPFFKLNIPIFGKMSYHRNFCEHLKLHETNIDYYLSDLGVLKDKPTKNNIGKKAKQNEYQFKTSLQDMANIEIIDKIFKLYLKNDAINFKIPDVILRENGKYSIIEYKTEQGYGDFQQILDYAELFRLATIEPLKNLYWVVHKIYSYDWWEFKNQAPKEIQVYSEDEFREKYSLDQKLGLDAWM